MQKVKIEREYPIRTSTAILYNCISSPSGLSEWFADNVNLKEGVFIFIWDGAEERAKMVTKKRDEFIKFKWEEDDEAEYYFEFRIKIDGVTKDVALMVTDYVEEDEVEESGMLWDAQIDELKRMLGN